MNLNQFAAQIKRDLRKLINKTIDVSVATGTTPNGTKELRIEAKTQFEAALQKLIEAEASLGDLFADQDYDNPRFGFPINEDE